MCQNCCQEHCTYSNSDLENDINTLNECSNFNMTNVDFQKYDDTLFNPLRFDHNPTSKAYNNITSSDNIHESSYQTPEQFRVDRTISS